MKEKTEQNITNLQTSAIQLGFNSAGKPDKFSGKYTVDLMIAGNDSILEQLNSIHSANSRFLSKQGITTISDTYLVDSNKNSGNGFPDQFKNKGFFKLKAKSSEPFPVFDAEATLLGNSDSVRLNVGDTVIANLTLSSYSMAGKGGTTVYINGLQIIKKAEKSTTQGFKPVTTSAGKKIQL